MTSHTPWNIDFCSYFFPFRWISLLLLIYLEFVVFFSSRFFVSMDKAKAGAKKGIAIINCLWIVIISLFIAFDCSMQQNIVVRKKGSKPGHAFKKFIDKNYIASTIHGVLFPFDGFFSLFTFGVVRWW